MNLHRIAALVTAAALFAACGPTSDSLVQRQSAASTAPASGVIPPGLPSHMAVGLFEGQGATWMKGSGVPWDIRYAYLTNGWSNNWGWGAHDGSWSLGFMNESDSEGFIPAVEYYCVNGEPPADSESSFLMKVQNPASMADYFGDFKLLLQNIKTFGKPVVVLLEGDGFGFLQQQTQSNPNAPAAVASSGLPELASLPDTVAGWGLAFLQLRQAVGATNAIFGIHISEWASGNDVAYAQADVPLEPEVDKVYGFLSPFGLAANATGSTYDLLVGDPLDRDSDYYSRVLGTQKSWDPSDSASTNTASFNRYAAWLQLWNQASGKRWILWQIPLGNSNHEDVCNTGEPGEGYKDNRAEYFFGPESATHLATFAQSGVVGLLFGAGAGCQSSYQNDIYTDGKPFMQTHVSAYYASGGVALPQGGSFAIPGLSASSGPIPEAGAPSALVDASQYGFEGSTSGWSASSGSASLAVSAAQAFAGEDSLAVSVSTVDAESITVSVASPGVPAGATVAFHVWIPAGASLQGVQPYVLQGAAGGWSWTGNWQSLGALQMNAWNTIAVQVPSNAAGVGQLGLEVATSGPWSGTLYVDAVTW